MKIRCDKCGGLFDPRELDAKPVPKDKRADETDEDAADRGVEFSRLECRACYGPGFSEM